MLQRVRLRDIHWTPLLLAMALTAFGIAFVISACFDPGEWLGLGREAKMQIVWWCISLGACFAVMHVPLRTWKNCSVAIYLMCLAIQLMMLALADTALVPRIKGQCNWIALGPLRLQPSEFIKIGALLASARLITTAGFDASRFGHVLLALAVAGLPALLIATQDLGSALTFVPMIIGMLFLTGMRVRHLALMAAALAALLVIGVQALPREGPRAYQYQRIQAWLHPEEYALSEGYQTMRSIRSIGSGQWTGKGYAAGDQNRLGWLPEKHTDLIFAVVGEEIGFFGSALALLLFLAFGWSGIYSATRARDPFGCVAASGFVCLVIGQVTINLAVALGLMPVTGITLPFFSYGGSSLLGCYLGLGLLESAAVTPRGGTSAWSRPALRRTSTFQ